MRFTWSGRFSAREARRPKSALVVLKRPFSLQRFARQIAFQLQNPRAGFLRCHRNFDIQLAIGKGTLHVAIPPFAGHSPSWRNMGSMTRSPSSVCRTQCHFPRHVTGGLRDESNRSYRQNPPPSSHRRSPSRLFCTLVYCEAVRLEGLAPRAVYPPASGPPPSRAYFCRVSGASSCHCTRRCGSKCQFDKFGLESSLFGRILRGPQPAAHRP